jgi:PKHD-type hydroxylase
MQQDSGRNNYKYYKITDAFTPKEIKKILQSAGKVPFKKGTISHHPDEDNLYRKSDVKWLRDSWLINKINKIVTQANETCNWNYEFHRAEPIQYTEYQQQGHYDWHQDCHTQANTVNDTKSLNHIGLMRKLSVTVQLSDAKDYEGGDFEISWQYAHNIHTITLEKSAGTIVVFPSFLWHRVTPVTKGCRKSLVQWYLGEPFK